MAKSKLTKTNFTETLVSGVDYEVNYAHVNPDETPASLAGATVYFTIKEEPYNEDATDSEALVAVTTTSHDDAANGLTSWSFSIDPINVEPQKYYYDVTVKDSSGRIAPPSLYGEVYVSRKVTNKD